MLTIFGGLSYILPQMNEDHVIIQPVRMSRKKDWMENGGEIESERVKVTRVTFRHTACR